MVNTKKKRTKRRNPKVRKTRSRVNRGQDLQGDGLRSWLKKTKVLSTVGGYVLPALGGAGGGALGAAAGTFEAPVVGTIAGGYVGEVAGAAGGALLNKKLERMGYGKTGTGKRLIHKRTQFATGKRGGLQSNKTGQTCGKGLGRVGGTIGRGKKFDKVMSYGSYVSPHAALYTTKVNRKKKGKGLVRSGHTGMGLKRSGRGLGRVGSGGRVHRRVEFAT